MYCSLKVLNVGDYPLVIPPKLLSFSFLCRLLVFQHAEIVDAPPVLPFPAGDFLFAGTHALV